MFSLLPFVWLPRSQVCGALPQAVVVGSTKALSDGGKLALCDLSSCVRQWRFCRLR